MTAGRPSEKTPETIKKLEEAFAMDCPVTEACLYADISTVTYYTWIKDDPELLNRFNELRENPFLKARSAIVNGLSDPEFALKYMERKKKAEFSPRTEITGADGERLIPKPLLGGLSNTSNTYELSSDPGPEEVSPTEEAD